MQDEGGHMSSCADIRSRMDELAAYPAAELPAYARAHVAGCRACARDLAAARLTRGLLSVTAEGAESPVDFSRRVLAALPTEPTPPPAETDLWRLAWGLVPAFTATAVALLILYSQDSDGPSPVGLLPTEGITASEQLVLQASPPDLDLVLTAVMEGGKI
jgi:hypothetical protein